MSDALDGETEYEQRLDFRDMDGDGQAEILVYFTAQLLHAHTTLEIIKVDDGTYSTIVVVRGDNRAGDIEFFDFDSDGISEIYGPLWGGTGELWVKRRLEDDYQNVLVIDVENIFYESLDNGLTSALRNVWAISGNNLDIRGRTDL